MDARTDVTVTALKTFPYRGRQIRSTDVLEMDPVDAMFYQRYGLVSITISQHYLTRQLIAH